MKTSQFTTLDVVLTKEDYQLAKIYADIQKLCRRFLDKHNKLHKNSMNFVNSEIDHDYYIWHVATTAFKRYLLKNKGVKVETWENNFNIYKVLNILNKTYVTEDNAAYVHNYFCNRYHIKIKSITGETVYDIRAALTRFQPKSNWNFLFSIDKANVRNIDTVLLYCIGNKDYINKIIFSGLISHNIIKQCPILRKGQQTASGIINKTDNYVTTLNKHYIY